MIQEPSQSGVGHSQQNMYATQARQMDLDLLSLQEVAELLRVSKISIYRMVARQVLAVYRIGRRMRFRKEDVLRYLERNRYGCKEN